VQVTLNPIDQGTIKSFSPGGRKITSRPLFSVCHGRKIELGMNFVAVPDGQKIVLVSPNFSSSRMDTNIHGIRSHRGGEGT